MQKRVIAVFFLFCFVIGALCVRVYTVCTDSTLASRTQSHYKKITLDTLRLPVYDSQGRRLLGAESENYLAAKPGEKSLSELNAILGEGDYNSLAPSLFKNSPSYICVGNKNYPQTDSYITLKKYVRYSDNQTAVHLLGYVNSDGDGVSGIERCCDSYLKTDISLYAGFLCDVNGKVVGGADIVTDSRYNSSKGGVTLTLDSRIQHIAEEELSVSGIKKGAVVICESRTGKIKASASVPTFDPNNVAASINDESSPLVNRALSSFAVGSVFKVAVAAAALESGIGADFSYKCTGSIDIDGEVYHCNDSAVHGELDMQKALACSCNCYFIELAKHIGAKQLLETARAFGFGSKIGIADGLYSSAGRVPSLKNLSVSGNLANFSFGQGKFTSSPFQIVNMFNAVACGGEYVSPYVVQSAEDAEGKTVYTYTPKAPVHALSKETADKLRNMLKEVITTGTAKNAYTDSFESAGKTATAQTGMFDESGKEKLCTWFGGFFPADNPKYTVVILKEDGVTGGADCAPVYKAIAERIAALE